MKKLIYLLPLFTACCAPKEEEIAIFIDSTKVVLTIDTAKLDTSKTVK